MAQGSIRIETQLNTKAAKKEVEALYNELKKLEQERDNLKKDDELYSSENLKQAQEEIRNLEREELKTAKTAREKNRIQAEYKKLLQETTAEFANYQSRVQRNNAAIQETSAAYQSAVSNYNQLVATGRQEAESTRTSAKNVSRMARFFASAKTAAVGLATAMGKKTLAAVGKIATSIKNKIVGGLRNAVKQTDSMRKKFLKIGLALVGMRGIWGGIRQIVSSALSNNERLQKQLTATKGVLGTALTPAIQFLTNALGQIVMFIDRIYSMITGTSLIAKYNAQQAKKLASSTEDAADAAKEYNKQMASFDVANTLSGNKSGSSSSAGGAEEVANFFETFDMSKWLKSIIDQIKQGDWYGVGETIAESINSAISNIDWTSIQNKVNTFCTKLGEAVNGFVNALDWEKVGNTVGNGINTITGGINSLVDSIDWIKLGAGLSEGLNSAVNTLNGEALGKTLSAKLKIITETLYGFFNGDGEKEGFNFTDLGKKIGETINGWFNNINWEHVGNNLSSAVSGIFDTISGIVEKVNWNDGDDSLTAKIEEFFKGIDWEKVFKSMTTAAGKVLGGLGSVIVQLLKDAWSNWKEQYIDPAVEEAGGNIIAGVFIGISDWLINIGTKFKDYIWDPFIKGLKDTFQIHSPSQHPDILKVGRNIIEGVFNGIKDWLKGIKGWIKKNVVDKFTKALKSFKTGTVNLVTVKLPDWKKDLKQKWENLKKKFTGTTVDFTARFKDAVTGAIRSLIDKLNSVIAKLREISIAGIKPFKDLKDIPRLARGGIVNNPKSGVQAIVGEAGPEAVLPLTDSVLSKLAGLIAEHQGNSGQIIVPVYLDGNQIAKYTVNTVKQQSFRLGRSVL